MQAAEEIQGSTICAPVNRLRARCVTCFESLENAYQPVAEAWAEKHERDALDADPDRIHRVELSITYHEIGLTKDHERFFHRWAEDIRERGRAARRPPCPDPGASHSRWLESIPSRDRQTAQELYRLYWGMTIKSNKHGGRR